MKKILLVAVIIVLFFISANWVIDQFFKSALSITSKNFLGTSVKIKHFSLGILNQKIKIKGIKIYHPRPYSKGVMVELPNVIVKYNLVSLLKRKIYLPLLEIELKELVVIKDKDGQLNVDALKFVKEAGKQTQEKKEPAARAKPPMQIDTLFLSVGKVVYKDFSGGTEEPKIQVFDINFKKKKYNNIVSVQQLAALILMESMKSTVIKGAKVYGVASLLGTGFLPAGAAVVLTGKDSSADSFKVSFDKAYKTSLEVIQKTGRIISEDKKKGVIKAKVGATDVNLKIVSLSAKTTQITVSARKYFIPQKKAANNILYSISEKLK